LDGTIFCIINLLYLLFEPSLLLSFTMIYGRKFFPLSQYFY
jgi:hypothetical protein